MAIFLRPSLSGALTVALFAAQTGCASQPILPKELPPAPPSLVSVAALGRTGVVATWETAGLSVTEPPKGWTGGFGPGAAVGARASVLGGLGVGAVLAPVGWLGVYWAAAWTAAGLAFAPVGALIGGLAAGAKAQSPEHVERSKAVLADAMAAANLPAGLTAEVIRLASEQTWHTLVPVTGQKPAPGDPEVGTVLELILRHVGLEGLTDPKTGKPVSLWTSVWSDPDLVADPRLDPALQLTLHVDARLFKVSDGAVLFAHSFQVRGPVREFSVWVADDARAFREELTAVSDRVATRIADAVFPGPAP